MILEVLDLERTEILLRTGLGVLRGLEDARCRAFLGVPFGKAERFAYAQLVDHWDGELDATRPGPACPQNRAWHEHLEHPTRRFYHREFREGQVFTYDEDCLNVNIYTPKSAENAPVIVFFYGGGTIGQTGIVTAVSDSSITVVEGNSSDRV